MEIAPLQNRPKKSTDITSQNFVDIPLKMLNLHAVISQRRDLATVADFCIKMWHFWKQDLSAHLTESTVLMNDFI